jgi:dienelactone hydrolase
VHTNEFTHIHGPEDVYAVAVHMQKQTYISPHRITLRGGSIGSKINAHLLAGIKTTKFASIFNGVHLVGGQGYPAPESLPTHIPILLAHAVKDEMAPYEQASTFMQALKPLGFSSLLIFVSQFGDHHMINSALTLKDVVSPQYDEFLGYVNMLADFMQRIDYGLLQPIYTAKAALPVHFKRNQYSAALLNKSRLLR